MTIGVKFEMIHVYKYTCHVKICFYLNVIIIYRIRKTFICLINISCQYTGMFLYVINNTQNICLIYFRTDKNIKNKIIYIFF